MSIASEIEKLNTNLGNSYVAVNLKGGTVPSSANFDNLATAIGTITELKGETRTESLMNKNGTTYTPTSGKNGITSITVTPRNKSLSVTPSTSSQSNTVPTNYSGYGTVTVSAVTSSIDSNITAGNIKNGVTILGVTGNLNVGVTEVSTETEMNNNLTSENLGRVFLYTGSTTASYTNNTYYKVSPTSSTDTFTVDLHPSNYAFQNSSIVSLDTIVFQGPYESTNYHVKSSYSVAKITTNATEFYLWINSYAESSSDYTIASKVDATSFPTAYNNNTAKDSTRSFQKDPTTFSETNWKKLTYNSTDGLNGNSHFVYVVYRKDSSVDSNNDRGYFVIEKKVSCVYEAISPVATSLNVTPTTSQQSITPTSPYNSFNEVNVSAVTSSIDSNISAGNIKSGVSILGVLGNYVGGSVVLTTKTITQGGTYNAVSDNADGYSTVTVNITGYPELARYKVTNGVASKRNQALTGSEFSNIESVDTYALYYAFYGCTGLTGALDLSSVTTIGEQGLYYAFSGCTGLTSVDLSSVTTVGKNGLYSAFSGCTGLTSVDLLSVTSVGEQGLYRAFYGCTGLTGALDLSSANFSRVKSALYYAFYGCTGLTSVDLSSATIIGEQGLYYAFYGCTRLTSADLSSITTIGKNGLSSAFYNCTGLTSVDLSSVTSVGEQGLYDAFYNCEELTTVTFSALRSISTNGLASAFWDCTGLTTVTFSALTSINDGSFNNAFRFCTSLTDVYFNSLKSSSFNYTTGFNYMLANTGTTTTHTLHFPSNISSQVSNQSGYPLFGGTSGYVTLAFDLPATS